MHQLRQHLRHIGHPIMGDRRYGGPSLPSYQGFTLHAFRTRLIHPDSGDETVIHAPLPEGFLTLLRKATQDRYLDILKQLPFIS
jgi:23S rRNA pseudouridine955/2504/2580 synthase